MVLRSNRFEEYSFHIRFSLIVFSKLSSKFHEQRSQQKSCVGTNPTCSLNVTKIKTSVDRNVYETFENVQIFCETFEIVRKITIWENVQCFYHAQVSCRLEEFGKLTRTTKEKNVNRDEEFASVFCGTTQTP